MPSLLSKYKKRRESHKADDGSSVASHEADQRSPSGSSVRSADASLGSLGGAATGALGGASSGTQFSQQLPQSAQQSFQQAQQAGQKVLHSPFLGQRSPDGPANANTGGSSLNGSGPSNPSRQNQSVPTSGSPSAPGAPGSGQQGANDSHGFTGGANGYQPNVPPHANQLPQGHYAAQHAPRAPQHGPQQHAYGSQPPGVPQNGQYGGPNSPMSPPPHVQAPNPHNRGPGGVSPQSPGMYTAAATRGPVSSPGGPATDPAQERDRQFQQRYRQPPHEAYKSPLTEPSETPWAEYAIQRACPSPRFGHSANYIAARDGELFIMGGIRDSDIMSDLWVIDTNMLTGYQLVTEGARVGARVGHSSLVLGNAHVMFGGDTKIEETDPLDDNLYLLNTSSLKWTVAQPVGPRPSGRYGHSLSNVGARIYVFGGQVDEQFYNDMWSFDLQSWRSPSARWERVQPVTEPPTPRTNHTVVTWNDKLYLFGGANGDLWYSDTWCFDPVKREWEQLDCTGYVPAPCQGHAATIIGDVMYVFGGMSSQGVLIDQLFALKLTTLKWYTFQNLGPGPSPRSGHSLTAFTTDKILVWGGTDQGNSAYVLDVSRINYPDDHAESAAHRDAAHDAPAVVPPAVPVSGSESKEVNGELSPQPRIQGIDNSGPTQGRANPAARNSMLFAKRRSVLAPSSPLRGQGTPEVGNASELPNATQERNLSRSPDAPSRSLADASSDRTPNRTHITPTSYISETEGSSDERFVSAVDLNDQQDHQNKLGTLPEQGLSGVEDEQKRSLGHTRGESVGGATLSGTQDDALSETGVAADVTRKNTLTRGDPAASQDKEFRHMESELSGMPGGLPSKPFTESSGLSGFDPARSDDSLSSIPKELNSIEDHDASSSRTPGLRRSQPQTNLSLRSLSDGDNADDSQLSAQDSNLGPTGDNEVQPDNVKEFAAAGIGALGGAAGAGIIGLSDQMNPPPNSHAASSHQVPNATSLEGKQDDSSNYPAGIDRNPTSAESNRAGPVVEESALPSRNVSASNEPTLSGPASHEREANGFSPTGPTTFGVSPHGNSDHSGELSNEPAEKSSYGPNSLPPVPSQPSKLQHARTPSALSASGSGVGPVPVDRSTVSPTEVTADPKSQSSPKDALPVSQRSVEAPHGYHSTDATSVVPVAAASGLSAGTAAELAQLREQVNAYRQRDLDGEHHKLREAHAARERQLLGLQDSHGQLQNEHSKLKSQHQDLEQRYAHVHKLMDGHVSTLQSQQQALESANAKLQEQQQQLSRLSTLERENADLKHQIQVAESARKHAEEQLESLTATHGELKSAHADLTDKHAQLTAAGAGVAGAGIAGAGATDLDSQVNQLVQYWGEYNRSANLNPSGVPGTRDLASSSGDDYRSLYETHKTAADAAQRELESSYSEQAQLKAQLRELSAIQSSAPSTADLDLLKEQHQNALSQLDKQHQEALLQAKSVSTQDADDLRARLKRLETQYEELSTEYHKAVDLSKNQQAALGRTREELNTSRAHAQRLEEQLEDASIHAQQAIETGDLSTQSVNSARTDQAALVIRDLRAQIVILEEEMQGQREQIMRLKKAALTTAQ